MKKWLFNPFVYVAGFKALAIGWAIMLLTALTSYYGHLHFDGLIDMHVGRNTAMPVYFIEQLVLWTLATIVFYAAGKLFSRSDIRFIDIAGTLAFARWPMIFCALLQLGFKIPPQIQSLKDAYAGIEFGATLVVFALVCLVFIIWMIALTYNAFAVSCNLKGGKATGVFIVALIVAEILSKIVLHFLYPFLIPNL